jgi:hypothetical protein
MEDNEDDNKPYAIDASFNSRGSIQTICRSRGDTLVQNHVTLGLKELAGFGQDLGVFKDPLAGAFDATKPPR